MLQGCVFRHKAHSSRHHSKSPAQITDVSTRLGLVLWINASDPGQRSEKSSQAAGDLGVFHLPFAGSARYTLEICVLQKSYYTSYQNFKQKLSTCAQSHALGTCTKFQLEIDTIIVISGILYFCSGAHFTNGVWAHDSKLLNKSLSSYFDANAQTKPYICTYHDSSVMTCAKFLLDWMFFIVYFTWLNVINHLLCKRITYFYKTWDHKLINYMWNH